MPNFSGGTGSGYYSGGGGAFGSRVGPISMPNPYGDLSALYPNLGNTNGQVSADVLSKLRGELSPETIQGLQEAAASFGVANGMPGSGGTVGTATNNYNLRSLGLAKEGQIKEGVSEYNSTLPTVSATQTVKPETQAEISGTNAVNRSAPDPAAANSYAQELFKDYLNRMNSPASGTGALPWYAKAQTGASSGWAQPQGVTSNFGSQDWVLNPRYGGI